MSLKETIWSVAGWGSPYCTKCGNELIRFSVRGGVNVCCSNHECAEETANEKIPYYLDEE
jgi:hypothetical protein